MKKLLLALLTLMVAGTLSACKEEEYPDRIQLEFWHMSPVGSESYSGVKQIITDFNESQDTYYVKGVGFSFWDYWDKVSVAIASDNAPDVGFHTLDNVVLRAESGAVFNLSDFIAQDVADGLEEFDTSIFYQNQVDFATYDGDLYAFPFTATTRVLYYNIDMFEEAGLTEADVPTTWSELDTIAHQMDIVEDGDIVQIGFDPTYGQGTYHGFLWQAGLDFFDENGDPTLNTQAHQDVLSWMINFNDQFSRSQLNAFGEANSLLGIDPFAAGRVAMYISTDGLYQTMKTYGSTIDYGVAPIPVPDENGVRVSWGSGFSIELYDNGEEDDEKAYGAWTFLKYLMDDDVQVELAEANGWLMSNVPAMESYVTSDPILEKIWEEVEYAVDKVYIPYAPNWHAADWQTYYDEVKAGTMTVPECLAAARALYIQKQENYNSIND